LKTALDDLTSKTSNSDKDHGVRTVEDAVFARVVKEVHDKDRRRRNLIVCLRESGSAVSDITLFACLCKDCLNFDLECDVSKTRRIESRGNSGVQPRRLFVTLLSETSRCALLLRAPLLRKVQDGDVKKTIFVNPDLTRSEADVAYRRWASFRERRIGKDPHKNPSIQSDVNNVPPIAPLGASRVQHQHTGASYNYNFSLLPPATVT